jgi:hypothetical protein
MAEGLDRESSGEISAVGRFSEWGGRKNWLDGPMKAEDKRRA